jgi:hypothetical protein
MSLTDRIAKLEAAARLAKPEGVVLMIINDPEDDLAAYRLDNLDQTKTIEIGVATPEAYDAYHAAAKAALASGNRRVSSVIVKPSPTDRR